MSSRRQSLVGLIETVELLETFAAMGWMLDGLLDGEIGDFGQFADVDILFNFSLKNFFRQFGGHFENGGALRNVCHAEIDCWTRGRQDRTCGWPDGLNLDLWVARLARWLGFWTILTPMRSFFL